MMKEELLKLDELSRRKFINYAAKAFLGVGLSSALPTGALASITAGARPTARNVIYLYMAGGMTHLDTFDPKPGTEEMGPTKTIDTNVPGIQLSEHFSRLAKQMDKVAIIRSMNSKTGAHEQANYLMHTSYEMRGTITHPGLGPWLNKMTGKTNTTLPGTVRIGGGGKGKGGVGFFEPRYTPLYVGNPDEGLKYAKRWGAIDEEEFDERLDLAEWMDLSFHKEYGNRQVNAYSEMYDEALALMKSDDLKAFDLSKESAVAKAAYGDDPFGKGCLLARRLIENDVRFVEVVSGGWDTHNDNFAKLEQKGPVIDQALSALLHDLEIRGLLEETMVVVATEFGRTPTLHNGGQGRNHHPRVFSTLLAGGGIRGGQVYGKSDRVGYAVEEKGVSVEDFNATIAYAAGLPLQKREFSPSGRPFTVAHKGQPVMELFS